MSVKCLAQEHNTMFLARAQTLTTQSEDESTNHEAIVHLQWLKCHMGIWQLMGLNPVRDSIFLLFFLSHARGNISSLSMV